VEKGKGKESLLVLDHHLGMSFLRTSDGKADLRNVGKSIEKKLGITTNSSAVTDLWRGIRGQLSTLLDGLDPKDLSTMSLGLSHSLSRSASFHPLFYFDNGSYVIF